MKTDVYDLRLFRAGQLVGQEPELSPAAEASLKNGVVLVESTMRYLKPNRSQAVREKVNAMFG